jgi:ribosome maturation factor RimP
MTAELISQKIEQLVTELLSSEPEYFLIEVKVNPTNNIKVYIDGDKGISIEKCVYFNRQLYKKIEEVRLFPAGDFSLEVSSPGVDKPLKLQRQYLKNIGRNVEVTFNDGSKKEGKLLQVTNEDIILEQINGKGKKAEKQQLVIPFSNIKTTTVQIQF